MVDKIVFKYADDLGNTIKTEVPSDCDLTKLMGYFINFTRMIGFHEGSWENVLNKMAQDDGFSAQFTAYDWADMVINE